MGRDDGSLSPEDEWTENVERNSDTQMNKYEFKRINTLILTMRIIFDEQNESVLVLD